MKQPQYLELRLPMPDLEEVSKPDPRTRTDSDVDFELPSADPDEFVVA